MKLRKITKKKEQLKSVRASFKQRFLFVAGVIFSIGLPGVLIWRWSSIPIASKITFGTILVFLIFLAVVISAAND